MWLFVTRGASGRTAPGNPKRAAAESDRQRWQNKTEAPGPGRQAGPSARAGSPGRARGVCGCARRPPWRARTRRPPHPFRGWARGARAPPGARRQRDPGPGKPLPATRPRTKGPAMLGPPTNGSPALRRPRRRRGPASCCRPAVTMMLPLPVVDPWIAARPSCPAAPCPKRPRASPRPAAEPSPHGEDRSRGGPAVAPLPGGARGLTWC